jgi:hypothetical protein
MWNYFEFVFFEKRLAENPLKKGFMDLMMRNVTTLVASLKILIFLSMVN